MIKGAKFRGISYKVGFGYFAEKQWAKALKEFLTLPDIDNDAQVCEMIATCYHGLADTEKEVEFIKKSISIYEKEEMRDKSKKLKDKFGL